MSSNSVKINNLFSFYSIVATGVAKNFYPVVIKSTRVSHIDKKLQVK